MSISKLNQAALTLLMLAARPVVGQEGKTQQAESKWPTPQHQKLDALVGTWSVATRFKVGPGRFMEGKAHSEAKWTLDGRVLRQEYASHLGGKPFTVIQYLGYDQARGKFFEIKMDSADTGIMHNEGTISEDGKVLTCVGERVDPETRKASKIRTVTRILDLDHYVLEWYMPDEQGKEENTVTLTHARKKP